MGSKKGLALICVHLPHAHNNVPSRFSCRRSSGDDRRGRRREEEVVWVASLRARGTRRRFFLGQSHVNAEWLNERGLNVDNFRLPNCFTLDTPLLVENRRRVCRAFCASLALAVAL